MAHYTLIARINTGNGKFPFVNVQFSKNHRPIPMEGATYYLRPSGGNRTPSKKGKDVGEAHAALIQTEDRKAHDKTAMCATARPAIIPPTAPPQTLAGPPRQHIAPS